MEKSQIILTPRGLSIVFVSVGIMMSSVFYYPLSTSDNPTSVIALVTVMSGSMIMGIVVGVLWSADGMGKSLIKPSQN